MQVDRPMVKLPSRKYEPMAVLKLLLEISNIKLGRLEENMLIRVGDFFTMCTSAIDIGITNIGRPLSSLPPKRTMNGKSMA